MNPDIELMAKIYQTYELDWMCDEIKDVNNLTKHHIVKKADGGSNDISNYALLTDNSHHLIHYLEDHYHKAYVELNGLFKELYLSLQPPTEEYYERVRGILKVVKKDIKNKKRRRNHKSR